jgi:glutamate carboxypeptidase
MNRLMHAPLPADSFDLDEMVTDLAGWLEIESPTYHPAGVNRMMDLACETLAPMRGRIERRSGRDGFGDLVTISVPGQEAKPGILVLAHLDTVHPVGSTAADLAVRQDGDRLYGPGAFDMKGGAYLVCTALLKLAALGERAPLPITVMFVPDEEVGSPTSREEIEHAGRQHRYVLVAEPADPHKLVTGRWAIQRFTMRTRGRPAHAGVPGSASCSAISEMAIQILRVEALEEPERKVTLRVGKVHAGMFVNVVSPLCEAEVLTVAPDAASVERVRDGMLGLTSTHPEITLEVEPGPIRPLFEPGEPTLALYTRARAIARSVGFDPGHHSVGGGSDANFTGALGIATLDGLGVCGGGFHTRSEFASIASLIPRARLLSGLFRSLT